MKNNGLLSQLAEEFDSKSESSRFDSGGGYKMRDDFSEQRKHRENLSLIINNENCF